MGQRVYQTKPQDVNDLRRRLSDVWSCEILLLLLLLSVCLSVCLSIFYSVLWTSDARRYFETFIRSPEQFLN